MKALWVLVILIALSGCASNSGVVEMGNNTYMVSRQAASGFTGLGTLKAKALKEAGEKCGGMGMQVNVTNTIDARPPYIFGNFPRTEIFFECI